MPLLVTTKEDLEFLRDHPEISEGPTSPGYLAVVVAGAAAAILGEFGVYSWIVNEFGESALVRTPNRDNKYIPFLSVVKGRSRHLLGAASSSAV